MPQAWMQFKQKYFTAEYFQIYAAVKIQHYK